MPETARKKSHLNIKFNYGSMYFEAIIHWHYDISILNKLIMNFRSIINSDKNTVLYNTNVHAIRPMFIVVLQTLGSLNYEVDFIELPNKKNLEVQIVEE